MSNLERANMISTRTLHKNEWQSYFDYVSRHLVGKGVDIQVISQDLGAQREGVAWQLLGLSYDPNDNSLNVTTQNLDHSIKDPTSIEIELDGPLLKAIQISQSDGTKEILQIMEPLALSAQQTSRSAQQDL